MKYEEEKFNEETFQPEITRNVQEWEVLRSGVLERRLTCYDPEDDARPELFHRRSKDG